MKVIHIIGTAVALILCLMVLVFVVSSAFIEKVGPLVKEKGPEDILRKEVYDNCIELIKRYNIYKTENFVEQANDIAKQYNSYILPYTELWKGNLPKELVIQLPYLQEGQP